MTFRVEAFARILISVVALLLGFWMHVEAEAVATGEKLILSRILIWGLVAFLCGATLAWPYLVQSLSRLASWAERRGHIPLKRRDSASSAERVLTGLFLVMTLSLISVAMFDPDAFVHLFREDGPFETATAVCYGVSSIACLFLAVRVSGQGLLQISLALLALLFFVVGAEEISWGQRLIGFDTPAELAAVNVQEEFTLHNIYSISLFTYPALATTAMLLFVAPLLRATSPDVRKLVDAFSLPVAPPVSAILYGALVAAYLVVGFRLGTPLPLPISYSDYAPHYDDEMLEFLISAQFTIFALTNWRLDTASRTGLDATQRASEAI